jgi:hypothetical protein
MSTTNIYTLYTVCKLKCHINKLNVHKLKSMFFFNKWCPVAFVQCATCYVVCKDEPVRCVRCEGLSFVFSITLL